MTVHSTTDTNARLSAVIKEVDGLIQWAEQDAQHAILHDAKSTAADDRRRRNALVKARDYLGKCLR
jgi:hypothetical protein